MVGTTVFPKADGDIWYGGDANSVGGIYTTTAGETLTSYQYKLVYIKKSDGKVYYSDASVSDRNRANGVLLNAPAAGATTYVQVRGNFTTSGLTALEEYYLSTLGTISTTASGVRVGFAISTTILFIDILQDDRDTIGTVKAYMKSQTGLPSNNLSAFWVECNGQTLSDTESPLNNQPIPDLNTTPQFLRGDTTSGTGGGANSYAHNHQWHEYAGSGGNEYSWASNGSSHVTDVVNIGTGAGEWVIGEENDFYTINTTVSALPAYYKTVWIMKIK